MSDYLNRKENNFSPQRQAKKINAEKTRAAQIKELEYRLQRKLPQKYAQDEKEADEMAMKATQEKFVGHSSLATSSQSLQTGKAEIFIVPKGWKI